jgi:hypothetical protein
LLPHSATRFRLSTSSSHTRKPYEASPYAALHATPQDAEANTAAASDTPASALPRPVNEEAARLAELRAALWAAFEAGTVPAGLIDLTMAYTSALRLEMSLTTGARTAISRAGATGPPLRSRG